MSTEEYFGIDEACRRLKVKRSTIYRLVDEEGLPAIDLSKKRRQLRFHEKTWIEWIDLRSKRISIKEVRRAKRISSSVTDYIDG